jgi:hypothetical protein
MALTEQFGTVEMVTLVTVKSLNGPCSLKALRWHLASGEEALWRVRHLISGHRHLADRAMNRPKICASGPKAFFYDLLRHTAGPGHLGTSLDDVFAINSVRFGSANAVAGAVGIGDVGGRAPHRFGQRLLLACSGARLFTTSEFRINIFTALTLGAAQGRKG